MVKNICKKKVFVEEKHGVKNYLLIPITILITNIIQILRGKNVQQ